MRILYIDVFSLLRSKSDSIDIESAHKLAKAAEEANLMLYPTLSKYTRGWLVENKVFDSNILAPDSTTSRSSRLDDSHPVRHLRAHAHALSVSHWWVCGDFSGDELLADYRDRYLSSRYGAGVTDELTDKIRLLKS
ncbi:hypothetical protein [Vibrio methylphosphonaticus]|uniref:hypothetical protein n=1 Tax=Vibrio methylphosphonaticus TaxID=2946866 RepID=UPI00202AA8EE|nr:hypothetical protein [Vibrio methylphosphonaticus]MCL9774597.1 hypothetical protein [Vibrio methylphosphonaticus]